MPEPSETAVNEERVNDFREHCNRLRDKSYFRELEDIESLHILRSNHLNLAESAKRREYMEAQVTKALTGAGPSANLALWQVLLQYLVWHLIHRGAVWASGAAQAAQFVRIILRRRGL